jgi:solute carrier family 25 protein 14/30
MEDIFARVDLDGDGIIQYSEFSAYVDAHEYSLRTAFDAIDVDGSGEITKDELKLLLDRMHMKCEASRIDELLRNVDTDGSGTISFEEWRSAFALLDPEDLLRSLDESVSFTDDTAAMAADLFGKLGIKTPRSGVHASKPTETKTPIINLAATSPLAAQLLPGGLAGVVAQTVVQPIETVKVRLQAGSVGKMPCKYGGSISNCFRIIMVEEGVHALWKGMYPSALRELSYSTLRFGLYKPIKTALGAGTPRDTPVWKMMAAGGAAGGIASFIANPTDLLKTRMQADAGLVPQSMAAHMSQIYQQSGVLGFWRGASATVARAVTLGAVKMASYDATKIVAEDRLGWNKGTLPNTLISCLVSSGFVVASSAPIDFLRTQMMAGKETGGMLSIATKAIRAHGPLVLWRGWVPQYMRILPYGTLQFIFMERIANALGASMT